MLNFPIVDSHVHFWHPQRLRYPWLDAEPALNKPFLPDDHRQAFEAVEIEALLFVQCDPLPEQNGAEAAWVEELARAHSRIQGIVAGASLEQGDAIRPALDALSASPLVKGVRRLLQGESDPQFCLRPEFVRGVQLLADYGFTFDLCVRHHQLAAGCELVQQCPDVGFVLDHIGKPDIKNQILEPWKRDIEALSRLPNVWCKISGLVTEANPQTWTPDDLRPYIEHVLTCFEFDRVLYGSDWPVVTLAATPLRWIETLAELVQEYSTDEQEKLWRRNARQFYKLDDATNLTTPASRPEPDRHPAPSR